MSHIVPPCLHFTLYSRWRPHFWAISFHGCGVLKVLVKTCRRPLLLLFLPCLSVLLSTSSTEFIHFEFLLHYLWSQPLNVNTQRESFSHSFGRFFSFNYIFFCNTQCDEVLSANNAAQLVAEQSLLYPAWKASLNSRKHTS